MSSINSIAMKRDWKRVGEVLKNGKRETSHSIASNHRRPNIFQLVVVGGNNRPVVARHLIGRRLSIRGRNLIHNPKAHSDSSSARIRWETNRQKGRSVARYGQRRKS